MKKIEPYQDQSIEIENKLNELRTLKREKLYDKALETIDFIETNYRREYFESFVFMITLNKERSIIYKKLKRPEISHYYSVISEIGGLLNSFARCNLESMIKEFYYTSNFQPSDNPEYKTAIASYLKWIKPLGAELIKMRKEIKKEIDRDYLKYEYNSSDDLEMYVCSKNENLNRILKQIEDNPFSDYIKKPCTE